MYQKKNLIEDGPQKYIQKHKCVIHWNFGIIII
jgi:hypothetical protein